MAHGVTWLANHAVPAYIVSEGLYSLINIWAYFVVTQELFRLLPRDVRTDLAGGHL